MIRKLIAALLIVTFLLAAVRAATAHAESYVAVTKTVTGL